MSDVCLFPMYAHYFPASNCHCIVLKLLHLLEFCAATPFTCFYVFLVLFSFLFCLQLFTCVPARCSKILSARFSKIFHESQVNISTVCLNCEKVFVSLRISLSMNLDLRKLWIRAHSNHIGKHQFHNQVSFIYFSDLHITFENYCLLKAPMNFLGPGVQRLLSVVR